MAKQSVGEKNETGKKGQGQCDGHNRKRGTREPHPHTHHERIDGHKRKRIFPDVSGVGDGQRCGITNFGDDAEPVGIPDS